MRLHNVFKVEIDNGKSCDVTIECFGTWEKHGADADGSRGQMMFFVTDEEVIDVEGVGLETWEKHEAELKALAASCEFNWQGLHAETENEEW